MGFDYYLVTNLIIGDKKDGPAREVRFGREGHYTSVQDGNDNYTYAELVEMERHKLYSYKKIYDSPMWEIRNPDRIEEYTNCLKENGIELENVKYIYRKTFCED